MPRNSACAPAAAPTRATCCRSAIDKTAGARVPLMLGPGDYRVGGLKLPAGTQLIGVRGATRLIFTGGAALIAARGADHVTLAGLVLDGGGRPLPENGALVRCSSSAATFASWIAR